MNAPVEPATPALVRALVTLKLNGKSFTCTGKAGKRRCKNKEFRVLWSEEGDIVASEMVPVYECPVCFTQRFGGHSSGIEEQLPPRNDWRTPGGTAMVPVPNGLWTTLHNEYRFNCDVASDAANRKTLLHFDESRSALARDWTPEEMLVAAGHCLSLGDDSTALTRTILDVERHGVRAFDNPPYQPTGTVGVWLEHALKQVLRGAFSVHLVPMSSSVGWFNDFVVPHAEWHTFHGRIPFEDPLAEPGDERMSPKQDNVLVIFDPNSTRIGHTTVRDARTGEKLWEKP